MKAYLRAKLILFSELLPKKAHIIADKFIKEYSILKKISKNRKLRLLDINKKFNDIKNLSLSLPGSFQIKNLSMAILSARLCNLNDAKINSALKKDLFFLR